MTQIVQAKINGNIETINTFTFTESINSFYNVLTFTADRLYASESDVVFSMGEKGFAGFIFSSTKTSASTYSMVCRSHSAKLTEPYISSAIDIVIPATTSHGVCAYYANLYNIPIIITSIDLDFAGDFEQKGTVISALTNIANVTGAEFWFDGVSIHIEPNKAIPTVTDLILLDTDIFDFVPFAKTIEQRGIGEIVVGAVPAIDEITTQIKCTAEVDKCSGEVLARVVPHDAFVSSRNIELNEVKTPMIFNKVIATAISSQLEADIVSVQSVKLNDMVITDYTFIADTLVFSTSKRGTLMVEYIGYGLHGYTNIIPMGDGRYSEFDIYYGACEVFKFQDAMSCSDDSNKGEDNNTYSVCGGVYIIMPVTKNYASGFTYYSSPSNANVQFYSDTQRFYPQTQPSPINLPQIEKGLLSNNNGIFTHQLRFSPQSLTEVTASGEPISPSLSGNTLTFDKMYSGVLIAYMIGGFKNFVKFDNMPNENIRMLVSGDEEGECEYSLEGYNQDNNSSLVCAEGVTATVDIVGELGVVPVEAIGKSVSITDPLGNITTQMVNNFGKLRVPTTVFGTYTLDTVSIQANSEIKLLAGNS